jgi:hypothetical protein
MTGKLPPKNVLKFLWLVVLAIFVIFTWSSVQNTELDNTIPQVRRTKYANIQGKKILFEHIIILKKV